MQLFLENFFASGLSILEAEIMERQQLEEELRKVQAKLKQKEMLLEQTRQKLQCTQDYLIQTEKMAGLGKQVRCLTHEIMNPNSFIEGNLSHGREEIEDLLHIINLYAKHYPQPVAEIQSAIEEVELDFLIEDLPKTLSSMQIGVDCIRKVIRRLGELSGILRLNEKKLNAVNLHEEIDNTLHIFHDRLKAGIFNPDIQIIKEYGDLPLVECYPGQLNYLFMTLLNNAIDVLKARVRSKMFQPSTNSSETFTHYSPTITIRTSVSIDSSHVIIQIADNGLGMTEEILSRLFDPYPMTQPHPSNGLSLFISHHIVENKHGGQLRCVSELEKGTEITIKLPIRQQQQQPS